MISRCCTLIRKTTLAHVKWQWWFWELWDCSMISWRWQRITNASHLRNNLESIRSQKALVFAGTSFTDQWNLGVQTMKCWKMWYFNVVIVNKDGMKKNQPVWQQYYFWNFVSFFPYSVHTQSKIWNQKSCPCVSECHDLAVMLKRRAFSNSIGTYRVYPIERVYPIRCTL